MRLLAYLFPLHKEIPCHDDYATTSLLSNQVMSSVSPPSLAHGHLSLQVDKEKGLSLSKKQQQQRRPPCSQCNHCLLCMIRAPCKRCEQLEMSQTANNPLVKSKS